MNTTFEAVIKPECMEATAECCNFLPRPGRLHESFRGEGVLGRFAADCAHWQIDDLTGSANISGQGDSLTALALWHEQIKTRAPEAILIGYVAYEMGYAWIGLKSEKPSALGYPLMQFFAFEHSEPVTVPVRAGKRLGQRYDLFDWDSVFSHRRIAPRQTRAQYKAAIRRISDHIAEGDIYQANYTQAFDVTTDLTAVQIAERFADRSPSPYGIHVSYPRVVLRPTRMGAKEYPALSVHSVSPELFFRLRSGRIETRPIKGTIARGADEQEDRCRLRQLLASDKNRAELLMITDLERNDVGQIAEVGSVDTIALCRPRATAAVWHLESVVRGTMRPSLNWTHAMRALFPGGSVTGAPKRRAMEILDRLEPVPRGVYCGALGWVDAGGNAEFALAIRTAVKIGRTVRIFGGGGIVADSDPDDEYDESLVKIAPMMDALLNDDDEATARRANLANAAATTP